MKVEKYAIDQFNSQAATAVGTAMAIHSSWNKTPFPTDIIKLKLYTLTQKEAI